MGKAIMYLTIICILSSLVIGIEYEYKYSPYTYKLDRTRSNNQSGNNITADNFFGNLNSSYIINTPAQCPSGSFMTEYNGTNSICSAIPNGANINMQNYNIANVSRITIGTNTSYEANLHIEGDGTVGDEPILITNSDGTEFLTFVNSGAGTSTIHMTMVDNVNRWFRFHPYSGVQIGTGWTGSRTSGSGTVEAELKTGSSSDGLLKLYRNGVNKVYISAEDDANNFINIEGNFGLGISTPQAKLHIASAGDAQILLTENTYGHDSDSGGQFTMQSSTGNLIINNQENGGIDFRTNDAQSVMIDSTGNVGIGESNPNEKLTVVGNVNITGNVVIGGNISVKKPYGIFSSNESQVAIAANTVYTMNFSHVEDNYLMELEGNENITIKQSGDYLITLSGLFVTDTNNKHFNIFPQTTHADGITMANVPRSNTRIEVENAGTHGLIAVSFILDLNAGDKFRIMYSSDDAGSMTVWTAGHGAGVNTVPETPSMIMTANKVSEIH